jgi:two-component system cell cycle response regulator CtrA
MRALFIGKESTLGRVLPTPRSAGVIVDQTDCEDAVSQARHHDYDVLLIEPRRPGEGAEVLRAIRNARIETPAIVLAPIPGSAVKVKALALGADDCISEPIDPAELLARMQAVVRRTRGYSQNVIQVGRLILHLGRKEASVAANPIPLTRKEYAILELLVLRKGSPLTKEAFLNHLYGGMDEPEPKIVDVFVCHLRRKLAEAGIKGLIGTVWGIGYVLRAPANVETPARQPTTASHERRELCAA